MHETHTLPLLTDVMSERTVRHAARGRFKIRDLLWRLALNPRVLESAIEAVGAEATYLELLPVVEPPPSEDNLAECARHRHIDYWAYQLADAWFADGGEPFAEIFPAAVFGAQVAIWLEQITDNPLLRLARN